MTSRDRRGCEKKSNCRDWTGLETTLEIGTRDGQAVVKAVREENLEQKNKRVRKGRI
jgi:hypothetical protein